MAASPQPAAEAAAPGPEVMTGADATVRSLEELGVDNVFGLPGGAVLPLYDAEIDAENGVKRLTNRAGGIEGGMTTGEPIIVRAAMKPISTVPRALSTVDVATQEPAKAHHQRSDVCAVPAAGVVAEAMVALELAQAVLEKCGGDSVDEVKRNRDAYLSHIDPFLLGQ